MNVKLAKGIDIPEGHGKARPRMKEDASSKLVLTLNTALNFWTYFLKSSRAFTVCAFLGALIKALAKVSHKDRECSVCTRKENQLLLDLAWVFTPE